MTVYMFTASNESDYLKKYLLYLNQKTIFHHDYKKESQMLRKALSRIETQTVLWRGLLSNWMKC
jgi:hypothetical protein